MERSYELILNDQGMYELRWGTNPVLLIRPEDLSEITRLFMLAEGRRQMERQLESDQVSVSLLFLPPPPGTHFYPPGFWQAIKSDTSEEPPEEQ